MLFPVAARAPFSLLAALMLVRLTDEWYSFLPVGAIVPIRDHLDLTYAQVGLVLISLPAGGIAGHGFTIAADFVSRRAIATFGAFALGACMIAFALADSFIVLIVAGVAWGSASDAFVHGCEVALVDVSRDDLAPALARVNAYSSIGDLLGPATLIAAAALGIEWRAVFAAGGGAMLLYGAWLATLRFPPPQPPDHAPTPLAGVLSVLRDRRIIVLALVDGLYGLLDEPFFGFTLAYLDDVRGLSQAVANAIVGAGVLGGLCGFLAVPALTPRMSRRRLMLVTGAITGMAIALLIAVPFAPLQAAAAFVFGFAGATFYSVLQASYLGLRPGQAGTTGAVVSTIGLAGVGFPVLVGAVADAHGLTAGLALYAVVPVAMVALLFIGNAGEERSSESIAG